MEILEFFSSSDKAHWISEMEACDWGAGQWLAKLLRDGKLQSLTGEGTLVPMLTENGHLVSFCTFAPLDEIQPTELTPWVGFVYTFPAYRGHRYAGLLLDWCECMATIMGKERVCISTDHIGLYEKYGYTFLNLQETVNGDTSRVYTKDLTIPGPERDARMEKGGKWKADVVAAARKTQDDAAVCGFSCRHCFLGQWCGGCKSFFNCCSYGTLYEKGMCPNLRCCTEKGLTGCRECPDLPGCTVGFYANGKDGNAAKAQALFTRKYGVEALFRVQDRLHQTRDFQKIQEILGTEVEAALKILEKNLS